MAQPRLAEIAKGQGHEMSELRNHVYARSNFRERTHRRVHCWRYEVRKFTKSRQLRISATPFLSVAGEWSLRCIMRRQSHTVVLEGQAPMLKILTSAKQESVILTLIGRIEGENLEELKRVVGSEGSAHNLVLDMKDVTLVDQTAIGFLAHCEADIATIENCPAYIRDWIAAEKRRNKMRER
jgi:hypothetical protein